MFQELLERPVRLQWFGNPAAAIALFRRNVELYPGSANVYDSLGDGLLARGARARARFQHPVTPNRALFG